MTKKKQLIQNINDAFQGVKLENGVGLWQGQGLDDYATQEQCKKLRERDDFYEEIENAIMIWKTKLK